MEQQSKYDLFVSHSSEDRILAYALCHYLEERGIRCWIAPRDVASGLEYAESIILGIRSCKIMVVVFNHNANKSLFVKNEVERAFNYKSIIIPFKIDDTVPGASFELFLSSVHWLDAVKGNAEDYFDLLYQNCSKILGTHKVNRPPIHEKFSTVERKYFIANNGLSEGPYALADLQKKNISPDDWVWTEGMADWLKAAEVADLKPLFNRQPPPMPKSEHKATPHIRATSSSSKNKIIPYKEIVLGKQIWMAENLNTSTFQNGDAIPEARNYREFLKAQQNKEPSFCVYDNEAGNGTKYGKLYNFYAVKDPRGLAPLGWHIPFDHEWQQLVKYLGGNEIAGKLLKRPGEWKYDEDVNIIHCEFNGLPAGFYNGENFKYLKERAYWWSRANYVIFLDYLNGSVYRKRIDEKIYASIRCIKHQKS